MKRLLLWAAIIGDRIAARLDKRVCRISNDMGGDED